MARRPKPEPADGTRVPFRSRAAKFVDEANFRDFHKRRREIERLWPACSHADAEIARATAGLRENALDALRAEYRSVTSLGVPAYLIAV